MTVAFASVPAVGGVIPVVRERPISRPTHEWMRKRPTWKLTRRQGVQHLRSARPAPEAGNEVNTTPVQGLGVEPTTAAAPQPGWMSTLTSIAQTGLQFVQLRDDRKAAQRDAANAQYAAQQSAALSQMQQAGVAQDRALIERMTEASSKKTITIVAVVGGIAALGVVAYMLTRKSK